MIEFISRVPIEKGWSEDKKYCVTDAAGTRYLLRVSPLARRENRRALYEILRQVVATGIPMNLPVDFWVDDEGVCMLYSWIDGEDLGEDSLPHLPETEQYALGLQAGEILRKIHSIPAPVYQEDWETRFNRKINTKIQKYSECGLRFEGDEHVLAYIEQNRHLLENRPQCFQHGDYHANNMMITHPSEPAGSPGTPRNGKLCIIDFDRYDFGDPWEEFNRIVWCAQESPHFATGMLRGYFDGSPPRGLEPPMEFFKLLALYIASNTLSSITWAIPFGQEQIDILVAQSQDVLRWYDDMRNPVPSWYLKDYHVQWIDGMPVKLRAPFDLSFLGKYGRVFKVFDYQDSGNLCFGTEKDGQRFFVKFAGAPTVYDNISPEQAIANLKRSVQIYENLAHPNLINLVKAEEIGGGFAMVFDWVDGFCMGKQYPEDRARFMGLPLKTRMRVFHGLLEFHAHVAKQNYVAIDFYDGSILWDIASEKAVICDIDCYQKAPYVNEMGRMWGSSRFMSPEEFQLGAVIDEVTNVFAMGAAAFALFAGGSRTPEDWPLDMALYDIAQKAVSKDRGERWQSIALMKEAWNVGLQDI